VVSGSVETFSTVFGKVQLDTPYTLTPRDDITTETRLPLVEGSARMPAFNINKHDPYGQDLNTFAASMVGADHQFETLSTDDGHTMLFYEIVSPYGGSEYYAFIDLFSNKKIFVSINGDSSTSGLNKDAFKNACRSFAFIE
jgi:hypothetical protein